MAKTKITSKGQITIPKDVRDGMGLRAGDEVQFVKVDGSFVLRRVIPDEWLDKWVGYLKEWEGYDVDEMIEEMRGR